MFLPLALFRVPHQTSSVERQEVGGKVMGEAIDQLENPLAWPAMFFELAIDASGLDRLFANPHPERRMTLTQLVHFAAKKDSRDWVVLLIAWTPSDVTPAK